MANIVKDGTINLQSAPTISAYAAAAGKARASFSSTLSPMR